MAEWSLIPLFWGALIFLLVNAFACLWRGLAGPTLPDRILAANVIGTKTMVVLVLLGLAREQGVWLDVALVYGLLSFTITLVASRLLETGRIKGSWSE
jgi:multicomponent Na+:H+ antiporter subunit F